MQMAKKPKTDGHAVLYRIVLAVLAVCVPVSAYFCNFFYTLTKSTAFQLLAQLQGDSTDSGLTEDFWSIRALLRDVLPSVQSLLGEGELGVSLPASVTALKAPAVVFVVCLVLAAALAVVLFFFACFSKKKTIPICISVVGVLTMLAMYIAFRQISAPFLDGSINLADFLPSSVISVLLGGMFSVEAFRLTTGYYLMLFLFIAMALWAGANKLIELGDRPPKEKKPKKQAE